MFTDARDLLKYKPHSIIYVIPFPPSAAETHVKDIVQTNAILSSM